MRSSSLGLLALSLLACGVSQEAVQSSEAAHTEVDRFDAVVRDVVHERTGQTLAAPKPKVRLVVDPTANAYIAGLPA